MIRDIHVSMHAGADIVSPPMTIAHSFLACVFLPPRVLTLCILIYSILVQPEDPRCVAASGVVIRGCSLPESVGGQSSHGQPAISQSYHLFYPHPFIFGVMFFLWLIGMVAN